VVSIALIAVTSGIRNSAALLHVLKGVRLHAAQRKVGKHTAVMKITVPWQSCKPWYTAVTTIQ
jgi:hypothetical protein